MPLETLSENDNTICCVFCRSPTVDEVNFGPIYARDGTACHYYCMLFSAALKQTGRDEEGILGFQAVDIYKEVRRAARLRCAYCRVYGASVGCCKKKCAKAFHFTCGVKNGANFQFYGQYEAFCNNHSKTQAILVKYKDWKCPICMSRVTHSDEPIMSNCCNSAVFHKECLKKMALNAGYFFKCPMCNAAKIFIDEMQKYGIFVPEQDASWEREPNAFEDLLFEYSKCDAEICECSKGREYNAAKGGFILARCRSCGAAGVHRQCGKLRTVADWACAPCLEVEVKTEEDRLKAENERPKKAAISFKMNTSNNIHQRIATASPSLPQFRHTKNKIQDDEEVDLSKVKISSSCFNFFPYLEDKMTTYQNSPYRIVPDWRGLTIRPNVVDWLGCYIQKAFGAPNQNSVGMKRSYRRNVQPVQTTKQRRTENNVGTSKNSTTSKYIPVLLEKPPQDKIRRKARKVSRWSRGAISKKRNAAKKAKVEKKADTISKPFSDNENSCKDPFNGDVPETVKEEVIELKYKEPMKRKVVELGYRLFASGMSKELFVQSNVEVQQEGSILEETDLKIDWNAMRPLGSFTENVGKEDLQTQCVDMNGNGFLKEIHPDVSESIEDKEEGILKQDSAVRDVRMEHSYCKTAAGELSRINGKREASSIITESGISGKSDEACATFLDRSKESMDYMINGKNI